MADTTQPDPNPPEGSEVWSGTTRPAGTRCPACLGNDADMPCAHPSAGSPGCLRDVRLGRTQPAGALKLARQEGAAHYNAHPSKGYSSPYAFARFPGITREEFDRYKRPLLDAFHEGWAEARRQDHDR